MKYFACLIIALSFICAAQSFANAQAGRTGTKKETYFPVPPVDGAQDKGPVAKKESDDEFTCQDTSQPEDQTQVPPADDQVYAPAQVTKRAEIEAKPIPPYTEEARRHNTSGRVRVRALLSSTGRVTRVKIIDGLPHGLTQRAADAACRIKFKPAMIDDRAVSQYVIAEYGFDLSRTYMGGRPAPRPRP